MGFSFIYCLRLSVPSVHFMLPSTNDIDSIKTIDDVRGAHKLFQFNAWLRSLIFINGTVAINDLTYNCCSYNVWLPDWLWNTIESTDNIVILVHVYVFVYIANIHLLTDRSPEQSTFNKWLDWLIYSFIFLSYRLWRWTPIFDSSTVFYIPSNSSESYNNYATAKSIFTQKFVQIVSI